MQTSPCKRQTERDKHADTDRRRRRRGSRRKMIGNSSTKSRMRPMNSGQRICSSSSRRVIRLFPHHTQTRDDHGNIAFRARRQASVSLSPSLSLCLPYVGCSHRNRARISSMKSMRSSARSVHVTNSRDANSTASQISMKKRSERRKHCAPAAVPHRRTESVMAVVRQSQNPPAAEPLPGDAGPPKLNQLEMVTTCTYRPTLVKIDARSFELSW